jgi:hypothetical protein
MLGLSNITPLGCVRSLSDCGVARFLDYFAAPKFEQNPTCTPFQIGFLDLTAIKDKKFYSRRCYQHFSTEPALTN